MMQAQSVPDAKEMPDVSWGLGLGLDSTTSGRYAWHWGDQGDSKALFVVDLVKKNGIVYFTNSANGLSPAADILRIAPGGDQQGIVEWVAYGRFDRQADSLYRRMSDIGVAHALAEYVEKRKTKISEDAMNMLGYAYLRRYQPEGAIYIFIQNTEDYPASYNTGIASRKPIWPKATKPVRSPITRNRCS